LDLGRLVSLLAEHALGGVEHGISIELSLPISKGFLGFWNCCSR
jgi:hypothetical protein